MREEKRWLRHGEMVPAILSFGCKKSEIYKSTTDFLQINVNKNT